MECIRTNPLRSDRMLQLKQDSHEEVPDCTVPTNLGGHSFVEESVSAIVNSNSHPSKPIHNHGQQPQEVVKEKLENTNAVPRITGLSEDGDTQLSQLHHEESDNQCVPSDLHLRSTSITYEDSDEIKNSKISQMFSGTHKTAASSNETVTHNEDQHSDCRKDHQDDKEDGDAIALVPDTNQVQEVRPDTAKRAPNVQAISSCVALSTKTSTATPDAVLNERKIHDYAEGVPNSDDNSELCVQERSISVLEESATKTDIGIQLQRSVSGSDCLQDIDYLLQIEFHSTVVLGGSVAEKLLKGSGTDISTSAMIDMPSNEQTLEPAKSDKLHTSSFHTNECAKTADLSIETASQIDDSTPQCIDGGLRYTTHDGNLEDEDVKSSAFDTTTQLTKITSTKLFYVPPEHDQGSFEGAMCGDENENDKLKVDSIELCQQKNNDRLSNTHECFDNDSISSSHEHEQKVTRELIQQQTELARVAMNPAINSSTEKEDINAIAKADSPDLHSNGSEFSSVVQNKEVPCPSTYQTENLIKTIEPTQGVESCTISTSLTTSDPHISDKRECLPSNTPTFETMLANVAQNHSLIDHFVDAEAESKSDAGAMSLKGFDESFTMTSTQKGNRGTDNYSIESESNGNHLATRSEMNRCVVEIDTVMRTKEQRADRFEPIANDLKVDMLQACGTMLNVDGNTEGEDDTLPVVLGISETERIHTGTESPKASSCTRTISNASVMDPDMDVLDRVSCTNWDGHISIETRNMCGNEPGTDDSDEGAEIVQPTASVELPPVGMRAVMQSPDVTPAGSPQKASMLTAPCSSEVYSVFSTTNLFNNDHDDDDFEHALHDECSNKLFTFADSNVNESLISAKAVHDSEYEASDTEFVHTDELILKTSPNDEIGASKDVCTQTDITVSAPSEIIQVVNHADVLDVEKRSEKLCRWSACETSKRPPEIVPKKTERAQKRLKLGLARSARVRKLHPNWIPPPSHTQED